MYSGRWSPGIDRSHLGILGLNVSKPLREQDERIPMVGVHVMHDVELVVNLASYSDSKHWVSRALKEIPFRWQSNLAYARVRQSPRTR